MKYSIAIAGTTHRTRQCAETLLRNHHFEISFIITPEAKPVGRKQVLTANPMEKFAKENLIPIVFIEHKIDQTIQLDIQKLPQIDLLLVVDFGYIIPNWLLKLPKIAPLNIHPSKLPRWRGSSPGQFAILFNEVESAVTLMVMDEKLDHGPIVYQKVFPVDSNWNSEQYYQHAFTELCSILPEKIADFARNPTNIEPQTEASPTITAKTIKKDEAFVPWQYLKLAMQGESPINVKNLSKTLQSAYENDGSFSLTLERASKAFSPWPNLWTIVPTSQGEKRMKILETTLADGKLVLTLVQIEGKNPTKWHEGKNSIV